MESLSLRYSLQVQTVVVAVRLPAIAGRISRRGATAGAESAAGRRPRNVCGAAVAERRRTFADAGAFELSLSRAMAASRRM